MLSNGGFPDQLSIWDLGWWQTELRRRNQKRKVWSQSLNDSLHLEKSWDIPDLERHIEKYNISESIALQKLEIYVPPFRDVKVIKFFDFIIQ